MFSELGDRIGTGGGAPRGGMGGLSVPSIAEFCWYCSRWAASCSCCISWCCASNCCCLCICKNSVWVCGSDLCDARNASFCASLRRCWFCRCICRNSICTELGECWFGEAGSRLITEFLRSISGVEVRLLPVDIVSSVWSNAELCSLSKPCCCV